MALGGDINLISKSPSAFDTAIKVNFDLHLYISLIANKHIAEKYHDYANNLSLAGFDTLQSG